MLVTFPGELTVQIGLNIKQAAPHKPTFVAGYTNGYIYYAPTKEQLQNVGGAQEDSENARNQRVDGKRQSSSFRRSFGYLGQYVDLLV